MAGTIRLINQIDDTPAITANVCRVINPKKNDAVVPRKPTSIISSVGNADCIKNMLNTIIIIPKTGKLGTNKCITIKYSAENTMNRAIQNNNTLVSSALLYFDRMLKKRSNLRSGFTFLMMNASQPML